MNRFATYSRRLMWFIAFLLTAFVAGYGTGVISTLVEPAGFSTGQLPLNSH